MLVVCGAWPVVIVGLEAYDSLSVVSDIFELCGVDSHVFLHVGLGGQHAADDVVHAGVPTELSRPALKPAMDLVVREVFKWL